MILELRPPIRQVVELLANGRHAELEARTNGVRLSAREMAKAIADYGRHLIIPPEEAYSLMDVVEIRSTQQPRWSVTMPLWTLEEGRSDLLLELTVIRREKTFDIELDDIHVL
jgi:hypothetical protein